LRTGWRFVIYLAGFFAVVFLLSFLVKFMLPSRPHPVPPLWGFLIGECVLLLSAVLPAVALARFERRPFGTYGLPRQGAFGKQFWIGALWGLAAITLLLLVMRGVGAFYFGGLALHGVRVLKFAVFWGVLFLVVGFAEEFLFRGLLQNMLARASKSDLAGWGTASILFGLSHITNTNFPNWRYAILAFFAGFFYGWTWRKTNSIFASALVHGGVDLTWHFLFRTL